jgi:hypothetical protein
MRRGSALHRHRVIACLDVFTSVTGSTASTNNNDIFGAYTIQ